MTEWRYNSVNSLAHGKFEWKFWSLIFQIISVIDGWGSSCELALRWMSLDLTDDKSTLVQVMAWCRQATSHYLSQCWPNSLSPYGVTKPQWVHSLRPRPRQSQFQIADNIFQCISLNVNHRVFRFITNKQVFVQLIIVIRIWCSPAKYTIINGQSISMPSL